MNIPLREGNGAAGGFDRLLGLAVEVPQHVPVVDRGRPAAHVDVDLSSLKPTQRWLLKQSACRPDCTINPMAGLITSVREWAQVLEDVMEITHPWDNASESHRGELVVALEELKKQTQKIASKVVKG